MSHDGVGGKLVIIVQAGHPHEGVKRRARMVLESKPQMKS